MHNSSIQDRVKKTGALALVLAAEHGQLEVPQKSGENNQVEVGSWNAIIYKGFMTFIRWLFGISELSTVSRFVYNTYVLMS